jgi:hypothetical protein
MKRWLPIFLAVTISCVVLQRVHRADGRKPAPVKHRQERVEAPAPEAAPGRPVSKHWAFNPPVRPDLPSVKNSGWARTPIDRFILARLEKEGLKPSPEADKITLVRRL